MFIELTRTKLLDKVLINVSQIDLICTRPDNKNTTFVGFVGDVDAYVTVKESYATVLKTIQRAHDERRFITKPHCDYSTSSEEETHS